MMSFLGWGAFSYCARIPGRRGPSPLVSSRATMKSEGDLSLSAGRLGAAPSMTMRSISPGLRGDGGVAGGGSAHAAADDGHGLGTVAVQVAHGGENIECELSIGGIGLAGAVRLAVAAKIDGEDFKAGADQRRNLWRPAFLGEAAAVNEQHGAICAAIEVRGTRPPSSVGKETVFCASAELAQTRMPTRWR